MATQAKSRVIDGRGVFVFLVLGGIGLLLDVQWHLNPNMMVVDGAIATGLGVLSIVKRQFRRLRHGTPPPEDLTQVSAGASSELRTAVLLVILGGALMLLGKSTVEGLFR